MVSTWLLVPFGVFGTVAVTDLSGLVAYVLDALVLLGFDFSVSLA